jgi:MraZ protein
MLQVGLQVATFFGQHFFSIDKKSRLTIPLELRTAIIRSKEGYDLAACPGHDRVLYLYTQSDYEESTARFDAKAQTDAGVRDYLRVRCGLKANLAIDSLGRVLIPETLLKHFGVSREVVLVGAQDHMEVWPKAKWNEHVARALDKFDATATAVLKPAAPAPKEASSATTTDASSAQPAGKAQPAAPASGSA